MTIRITSLLSPASDYRVVELVEGLRTQGLDSEFLDGSWEDRLSKTRSGDVNAVWVCGLLHVELSSNGEWPVTAVAAPTMWEAGRRRPVYFGRVVVAAGSPYERFDDLSGRRFAYNEESSLSGYRMMLDRLSAQGAGLEFFAQTMRSGSHVASLRMVSEGRADCAIIDSMVFDDLAPTGLRVVESVGPYPAPPLVARPEVLDQLASAATTAGWAGVGEPDYDVLRGLAG